MPQVTRTTNDLIINSLYLLGELGVGEAPDAYQLSTGLELINEILDGFTADSIYITYLTDIDFTLTVGKGTYSISDMVPADVSADRIVDLVFANYIVQPDAIEPIVYPLNILSKAEFYGVVRLLNLQARPSAIFLNKQPTESFITVYPDPDQPYPLQLKVKSMINSLSAGDSLIGLAPYYYGFLKYALAREFSSYYPSGNWNQQAEQKYMDYYNTLKNANETDLTVRPSATMNVQGYFYYWQSILALS